ncbi:vitellogenin-like [Nymphalis io]|uniref:vitellogenin-like n=1 Tax=Inachis io TaxID=171585 RepID=UPI00216765C0|nr:vitellogenin-like [Nymphalis io]
MKIWVLAAVIVAVSSGRLKLNSEGETSQWLWEAGKLYRYDVETHTLAHQMEGASTGNSFKARFTVRVKAPGHLQAKFENAQNAQVHQELKRHEPMPGDLKYQPVPNFDKPFEIFYEGGRVVSLSLPSSVSLAQENLVKGLIGALQVDLSTYRNVHSSHDTYDKESQQGLFRKMEADVTGDCETLYTASPAPPEWRRELPAFTEEEDPIEITKSKNYGHCHHRVDYHFGVPEGAEWTGTAHKPRKEQFIKRATLSRILVGKNGPIYKAETTSTVNVHPHLFGKQKAEVHSKVSFQLVSFEQDSEAEWSQSEGNREIPSLLYSLNSKPRDINEDSSSSSASHESVEQLSHSKKYSRNRRSVKPNMVVSINKMIVKNRNDKSDSSSSSESASAYVNDDIPKNNEPAYAAMYMNPQPHGDKKQNPMNAQKLVQEIAQQLQNPNNMPKSDFLSKFNILVRVIASMSYGQLSQTSRSIEIAKSSNDNVKLDMWMIYRDAVTQAGTSPAFQQIKTWIENKKIEGEEAAEVVAVLARSLRYPTKETMTQFFELAMSPEVTQQTYLNSSALIAATKFINMGQVNNETSHRFYPSHMYGRMARKHDTFVVDEVLPRLSAVLKHAIEQGDSHKSQVYVKAIGNLGHRAILDVFAPYLEGKTQVSTYLRTQIVENLRVLARQRDSHVQAVLYSILRNTAEPYEVRVAAIQNIFMSRPSSAMMQAMAQMTKEDPSRHVRATLKSAILSAAELKHPYFSDLARTAEAAKDMVTDESFGMQDSKKKFMQFNNKENDYDEMGIQTIIGSKTTLLPKTYQYSWRNRVRGWDEEITYYFATSNRQKTVNFFLNEVYERIQKSRDVKTHKYSAQKIADILNIENNDDELLEASLYLDFMNQQRLFAFTENDIKEFGVRFGEYLSNLPNGITKHYTKVVNMKQVSVMFPVAAGVPFIFKYKEPTLFHIQTSTTGKYNLVDGDHYKFDMSLDTDIVLTYAANQDGSVGFLDPLSNQYPSVGLVQKFQVNIPVKSHLQLKNGELKLRLAPREPEQDSTIVHYSVWPYTANQKKDSLVTVSQDPTTKVITRPNKVWAIDYKFGQQIGSPFQIQGYSYSMDYRSIGSFFNYNYNLSNIINILKQRDNAQTHFNLKYLGKQAKSKAVTFTAVYDILYNQKNSVQMEPVALEVNDVAPNSPSRREEIVKRATSGIKLAKSRVLDVSAQFESSEKMEFAATIAVGYSDIDSKTQIAIFMGRNSDQYGPGHINVFNIINKPTSISPMNFQEALNNELKMNIETDIRYNQKENIHIKATAERSKKYTEDLQNHPLGKECKRDIESGNNYQHNCHRAIVMAHAPDSVKLTVTYKDINPVSRNFFYQVFRVADRFSMWQTAMTPQKVNPDGKIDVTVDASYLTHTLNLVLNSHQGEIRLRNIPLPMVAPSAVAVYKPIFWFDRILNHYSKHQYQPYCTVDGNKVKSFSDRTFNYTLTRSWHVMLHDNRPERNEKLVVMGRRPSENKQEMYISYRSRSGQELEIELKPAPAGQKNYVVQVKTNAKKISEGEQTTYWDDVDEIPILEYHTEENGVLIMRISVNYLQVMYDGSRLVVFAYSNRDTNRGICGSMNGEARDDYLSPNGLIDQPEYYAASYALIEASSDPKEKELNAQAKKVAYQPKRKYTTILRSDEEWQKNMRLTSNEEWGSQIIYRARNYLKSKEPCELRPQVQYYENHGEICITTSALPACQSHCTGGDYNVQAAQVVCRSKLDQQFRTNRDQIRQGQNPKVTGVPQITQYRVPASCKA